MKVKIDSDLADLVPAFLSNRHLDIEAILSALKEKNFGLIKRTGHVMKGAGAGYGFNGITEIGKEIEENAVEENEKAILELVSRLIEYLETVEIVYE